MAVPVAAQGLPCGAAQRGRAVLGESHPGCTLGRGPWRPRAVRDGALWDRQRGGPGGLGPCAWLRVCGARAVSASPPLSHCRGTFYQGYLCTKCGVGAHKECLEVTPPCKTGECHPRAPSLTATLRHPPGLG